MTSDERATREVAVSDARARIADLVADAENRQVTSVLTRHGRPVAKVVPLDDDQHIRDAMRHLISLADTDDKRENLHVIDAVIQRGVTAPADLDAIFAARTLWDPETTINFEGAAALPDRDMTTAEIIAFLQLHDLDGDLPGVIERHGEHLTAWRDAARQIHELPDTSGTEDAFDTWTGKRSPAAEVIEHAVARGMTPGELVEHVARMTEHGVDADGMPLTLDTRDLPIEAIVEHGGRTIERLAELTVRGLDEPTALRVLGCGITPDAHALYRKAGCDEQEMIDLAAQGIGAALACRAARDGLPKSRWGALAALDARHDHDGPVPVKDLLAAAANGVSMTDWDQQEVRHDLLWKHRRALSLPINVPGDERYQLAANGITVEDYLRYRLALGDHVPDESTAIMLLAGAGVSAALAQDLASLIDESVTAEDLIELRALGATRKEISWLRARNTKRRVTAEVVRQALADRVSHQPLADKLTGRIQQINGLARAGQQLQQAMGSWDYQHTDRVTREAIRWLQGTTGPRFRPHIDHFRQLQRLLRQHRDVTSWPIEDLRSLLTKVT